MTPATFAPARIIDLKRAARGQTLAKLDVSHTSLSSTFVTPGQHAWISFSSGHPRPFACASPPTEAITQGTVSFLWKSPPNALKEHVPWETLHVGDVVAVSGAAGAGFPLERAHGKSLWLIAAGSGIAPMRACIEHILLHRGEYRNIVVLHGCRHLDEVAFLDEHSMWQSAGINVGVVLSRSDSSWGGRVGYVQQHLPAIQDDRDEDVCVLICGTPRMESDVRRALEERGISRKAVFTTL